jgi:SPP1 gp7 family putative phage head morphogenesis protein
MTATSRLQQTITDFRQRLLANEARAVHVLDAAYRGVLGTIQPHLDALYREIDAKLQANEAIPLSWLYEQGRLNAIKQFISSQVDHFGTMALMTATQLQHQGLALGQQAGMALLNATVPSGVKWAFGLPNPAALTNLIGATQAGSPLADLFHGFGVEAAANTAKALISGVTLGWNPRRIAPQIEQALNVPRWRALTVCRQEGLRCYKTSNLETYRANSDVVEQWRWACDQSPRTCAMCLAMDGTLHNLDEDFESHVQCRCSPVPVTKSWESILSRYGINTNDIPETSVAVNNYTSGADWFEQQSDVVKRQVLGGAKFAAYQDGTLTLKDLVGISHSEDWGTSRYEKSLKDVLGNKARQYYSGN